MGTRKHVIMRVERLPIEKEVESKDYFGKIKKEKGYVWKGYLTVHMMKLAKGVTVKSLHGAEGEDYFDGEEAIKRRVEQLQQKKEEPTNDDDDAKGNGAMPAPTMEDTLSMQKTNDEKAKVEPDTQTEVYEVELVIDKYADEAAKDKE